MESGGFTPLPLSAGLILLDSLMNSLTGANRFPKFAGVGLATSSCRSVLLALALLGLSAQAQGVFEAHLFIGGTPGGTNAILYAGKFWLAFDGQLNARFQAALAPFAYSGVVSAELQTVGGKAAVTFGQGEDRTYTGCDPLDWNPYLNVPRDYSPFTCPAAMSVKFYQGQLTLNPAIGAELLAGNGAILIRLQRFDSPQDPTTDVTGILRITGEILGRRFFVAPIESITLSPSGTFFRVSWASSVGSRYLVQSMDNLNDSAWENSGFAIVATSARSTIDVPVAGPSRFFRILELH
ncbi:MAG: hypothetical protein DME24_00630 [Verrucomicrobia bacterium]|nr:MAG: hypothetical protein DME24_00630 [Verrucomicrobiota bacterium]